MEDVHETGKPVLPPRDELGIRDDGIRDIGDESQEERPSLRRMD